MLFWQPCAAEAPSAHPDVGKHYNSPVVFAVGDRWAPFQGPMVYSSLWSHPTLPPSVPFTKAENKLNLFAGIWQSRY